MIETILGWFGYVKKKPVPSFNLDMLSQIEVPQQLIVSLIDSMGSLRLEEFLDRGCANALTNFTKDSVVLFYRLGFIDARRPK